MIWLVSVSGFADCDWRMPDKVISHSEHFVCACYRGEVHLEWDEVFISDGNQSFPPKPGVVSCSRAGRGTCPVIDARGQRDWSKCRHLPFSKCQRAGAGLSSSPLGDEVCTPSLRRSEEWSNQLRGAVQAAPPGKTPMPDSETDSEVFRQATQFEANSIPNQYPLG